MNTVTITKPQYFNVTIVTKNGYPYISRLEYKSVNLKNLISKLTNQYNVWYLKVESKDYEIFEEMNKIPYTITELEQMLEITKLSVLREKHIEILRAKERSLHEHLEKVNKIEDIEPVDFYREHASPLAAVSKLQAIIDYLSKNIDIKFLSLSDNLKCKLQKNNIKTICDELFVFKRIYNELGKFDPIYKISDVEIVCNYASMGIHYDMNSYFKTVDDISHYK